MIPFLDLKQQYTSIQTEIDKAVIDTLRGGTYVLGKPVEDFEKQFAAYCSTHHAIGLNNGTSALHLALLAANIGPGDEVITVSMTFVATVAAILYAGARPVLVEIDSKTWNMNPQNLENAITPRTKAIIPVHLHGLMADMDPIMAIAKKHNLIVIEDACQAHGATYNSQRAGSIGLMNAFSFYPGKNLGAYGEAGALVTADAALAKKVMMLRNWGQTEKYRHQLAGYNYRMESLQGAILSVKLNYIEEWTQKRRQVAAWYHERLANHPEIVTPSAPNNCQHVYHVFAIRVPRRDQLQQALKERGIMTNIHYPIPVHQQPAYANLVTVADDLFFSEQLSKELLSLPLYPELTESQIDKVCYELKGLLEMGANTYA